MTSNLCAPHLQLKAFQNMLPFMVQNTFSLLEIILQAISPFRICSHSKRTISFQKGIILQLGVLGQASFEVHAQTKPNIQRPLRQQVSLRKYQKFSPHTWQGACTPTYRVYDTLFCILNELKNDVGTSILGLSDKLEPNTVSIRYQLRTVLYNYWIQSRRY